jgi:hypothetical protein
MIRRKKEFFFTPQRACENSDSDSDEGMIEHETKAKFRKVNSYACKMDVSG